MKELILFRRERQLTQEEMARKMGVSKSYYSKVERGYKVAGRGFIDKFLKTFPEVSQKLTKIFF